MLSFARYARFVLLVTAATMLLVVLFVSGQEALTEWPQWLLLLLRLLFTSLIVFGLNYALFYARNPVQAYFRRLPMRQNVVARVVINALVANATIAVMSELSNWLEYQLQINKLLLANNIHYHTRLIAYELLLYAMFEVNGTRQRVALQNEVLLRDQSVARFEALKQQLSPHFLFNSFATLNWLIRADPAAAEQFVQQMSQVYRYVLHQGGQRSVTLGEELAFVEAYLYLLHMRFEQSLRVEIDIPAALRTWHLPPLAIQTVVENAVKHNIVSPEKPLTIRLTATADALVVRNTLQPRLSPEPSSCIGLKNLSARFQFLGRPRLITQAVDGYFTVTLPLFA